MDLNDDFVSPVDGGCWFCQKATDEKKDSFSIEFDCCFHWQCLKDALKENNNPEAEIIGREFSKELELEEKIPTRYTEEVIGDDADDFGIAPICYGRNDISEGISLWIAMLNDKTISIENVKKQLSDHIYHLMLKCQNGDIVLDKE